MKRKLKSKKINELIGDFLDSARYGNNNLNLSNLWESIIGKQVALETQNLKLNKKTLYVTINNPYLKADLISQKSIIINKLSCLNKDIESIVFN